MKAIVITGFGAADKLQLQDRPMPLMAADQVMIQVHAAGINRPDIFQRLGKYPPPAGVVADIPGLEIAGIITACGSGVTRWKPGDRVCALIAGGGYAEYVTAHASHCLPIPDDLNFMEAACLPETVYTVWHNVFQLGKLRQGEALLIHGGSGGIGTTAIQLAHLFGARVYATAGTDEKCTFCERLGAVACINYQQYDFAERLGERTIDVVLDSIGAPYFDRNLSLLAEEGRLVFINAVAGKQATLNIGQLMRKRLTLTGSTLRNRSVAFKAGLTEAVEHHVWPLLADGAFKPVIAESFALGEAQKAHELMESGNFIGKLVLEITR